MSESERIRYLMDELEQWREIGRAWVARNTLRFGKAAVEGCKECRGKPGSHGPDCLVGETEALLKVGK